MEDHLVYIIVITELLCFDYQSGYIFVKLLVGIYVHALLYGCFPDYDTCMVSDACFVNSLILQTEGSINMDVDVDMEMNSTTPSPSWGLLPYI